MHCINCGQEIAIQQKYCTKCGKSNYFPTNDEQANKKPRSKWKVILLTTLLTSLFWFFYYYGFVDKSNETTNIISHLLETVGRQQQAWSKSEKIPEILVDAFSEECLITEGCVDEALSSMTSLKAEIDKENVELGNLWSEDVIGQNFEVFYSSLSEENKARLMDVIRIYFPEETKNLETGNQLL